MIIDWELHVPAVPDLPFSMVAACCEKAEGVAEALAVHVVLTDDKEIHRINREYRGIDRATDVLSFPSVNYPKGKTLRDCTRKLHAEYDPDLKAAVIGDVIISCDHAKAQAEEYGHSIQREFCYLFTHSLFHLFGYDHMEAEEQKEMRKMEEKALQSCGITRETDTAFPDDEQLLSLAKEAMKNSYSPYSHYAVGAALLAKDGRVFLGCNVENASFGITNCAERTALFKAVSEGAREFETIAIASSGSLPYPCGACRQALNEFAPELRILVISGDGRVDKCTLPELLPHGFGPKQLNE